MTRLTEKQIALLDHAASRPDGSLLPLAETMQLAGGALANVLRSLKRRGLAIEGKDGGWNLTKAGRALVADRAASDVVSPVQEVPLVPETTSENIVGDSCGSPMPAFRPGTRQAQLLDLLQRKKGADTDEMMEVTGWQSHSVRAVLSGFRKRGIEVTRTREGNGVSVYRATLPVDIGKAAN